MSYTEPLSKNGNLSVNYDYNFRNYDNRRMDDARDRDNNQITDDPEVFIGNRIFDYSYVTHRVGANYNYRSEKIIYSLGASVEPNHLKGDALVQDEQIYLDRKGLNFAPILQYSLLGQI